MGITVHKAKPAINRVEVVEKVIEVAPAEPGFVHIDIKITEAQAKRLAGILAVISYGRDEAGKSGASGAVGMDASEVWPDWYRDDAAYKVRATNYGDGPTSVTAKGRYPTISFRE